MAERIELVPTTDERASSGKFAGGLGQRAVS